MYDHGDCSNHFVCLVFGGLRSTVGSAAISCVSVSLRIDFYIFTSRICETRLFHKTLATRLGWLYWMYAILASSSR